VQAVAVDGALRSRHDGTDSGGVNPKTAAYSFTVRERSSKRPVKIVRHCPVRSRSTRATSRQPQRASAAAAPQAKCHSKRFSKQEPINGIENVWNQAKRHLRRFNGIPKQHFHLFLREREWRFNTPNPKQQLTQLQQWISSFMGCLSGTALFKL
jgi:hypothetical protein